MMNARYAIIMKIACLWALVGAGCAPRAQTFQISPDASQNQQAGNSQAKKGQSQSQSLGWGSNIQNARIARAAELALQHGDKAQALDYARRATKSAPSDPQL